MLTDVAVLGGGPAGMRAALAIRRHGLTVTVIDEGLRPGGQVYRAPFLPPARPGAEFRRGERLRTAFAASGAQLLARHRAWFVSRDRRIACFGPEGPVELQARAVILAVGTTERVMPVPGITAPGVIGLAAATILLKAHALVPPGPTVVAGVGPLLYAVAAALLKAGAPVAAVVDLLRPAEWARAVPSLLSRPDLLAQGAGWMRALRRAGVAVHRGATVTSVLGRDGVEAVEISSVAPDWSPVGPRRTLAACSVAIGHGLIPATDFARALGIIHRFAPERGGWAPAVGPDRLAGELIYLAGDCAGISGAAAAEWAGELAGLAAARDLGALSPAAFIVASRRTRARLARAERFGQAISRMMALRPGLVAAATAQTIVCRCEDVTRGDIERVAGRGARTLNQLKSATRCGMGPCQGRTCSEAAAEIMARQTGQDRAQIGQWTARTPARPIALDAALGDYDYADIPRPPLLPA